MKTEPTSRPQGDRVKKILMFAGILVLVVGAYFLGSILSRDAGPAGGDVQTGQPGQHAAADTAIDESEFAPGTVNIGPERRQIVGIRIAEVRKEPVQGTLRVLGRVAADETALFVINAATAGWVMSISDVTPGALVKKDDVLATFYAPEVLGAQQAYVYSLNTLDRLKGEGTALPSQVTSVEVSVQQARDSLHNLGMSDIQMDAIAKTKERVQRIEMRSPATGIVVSRNIFLGLKFIQGTEFFRIADLRRVWIFLDVYENETQFLKQGARPKVSLAGQNRTFDAVVSDVLPLFDPESRTMKVRLEAENPGYVLRPDMFVDVELPVALEATLSVPRDAILDTGLKRTVFVDRGGGFFEPREVETGRRLGNTVEIVKGLAPGERIVVSGTFMIDSESRMELAAAGMTGGLAEDPVCGVPVSVKKAEEDGRKSVYKGTTYYFCSVECRDRFEKEPQKYAGKDAAPSTPDK
jgi:Cu(I)/Ag(I) efflux system membrane fusion protein